MKNVKNVVIETVLVQFSIINHMMHTIKGLKQVHLNCTKKLFFFYTIDLRNDNTNTKNLLN